jgi:lysophosphatidate acyltransferase
MEILEYLNAFAVVQAKILIFIGKVILYYASTIPFFAILSTRQEAKIWKSTPEPLTLFGLVKVYLYNVLWMLFSLIGSISLIPMWIQRGLGRSVEVEAFVVMEKSVGKTINAMFLGSVKVINPHNVPPIALIQDQDDKTPAPVFIANHCSQIDCAAVYTPIRRFKWIAKDSVRYLPGVGQIMALSGHVFIQRTGKNKSSVSNLYSKSNEAVQAGIPMMFFPQGTRKMTTNLSFKDGAFRIAAENGATIVPMSIYIPLNIWNTGYPFVRDSEKNVITITVHEPIPVKKGSSKEEMDRIKEQCQKIIYSVLPPLYHGVTDEKKTN